MIASPTVDVVRDRSRVAPAAPTRVLGLLRRFARTSLGLAPNASVGPRSIDRLEERTLLSTSPLPTLSQLESDANSVVRIETNFGEIDIELFDSVVPATVANFLNYVRTGRFSETFFHRRARPADSGVDVLQGGGFAFSNTAGFTQVPTDAPIALQYVRPNAERTVAMARTNDPNSATSQFYFNTGDNSTALAPNSNSAGFAVFGRVIQGWDVVTTISNLTVRNLTQDPGFAGTGNLLTNVPTTADYNAQQGVRETSLATIINAEVLKVSDTPGFYRIEQVMPEGWRSDFTTETVDLYNPNTVRLRYQIIAHYEVGGKNTNFENGSRDRVITEGIIEGGRRERIRITERGNTNFTPVVRAEEGYALVLKTAFADELDSILPLTAEIIRDDFNSSASESFINLSALSTQQKREWTFPRIERNPLSKEFLTFWNPNAQDANITLNFVTPEGPRTFTIVLNPYRRGGFALEDQGLAEGLLAARITSNRDIAVTLSDWDLAAEGEDVSRTSLPGFMVNGVAGGGAIVGGIAQVLGSTDAKGEVSLYNPTSTSTTVNLTAYRNDGTTASQSVTLLARSRVSIDVGFGLTDNQPATLMYNSGTVAIAAQYTWISPVNRNVAGPTRLDGAATMFTTSFASGNAFAGRYDPTRPIDSFRETVSVFNPFATENIGVRVQYVFSDGTRIDGANAPVLPRRRIEVSTQNQAAVIAKVNSAPEFRQYTILVSGTSAAGGQEAVTLGVVGLFRDDPRFSRTVLTNGDQILTLAPLSNPATIGSAPL